MPPASHSTREVQITLNRAGMVLIATVAAWLQMGFGPVRITTPVTGRVVDVDTKAPIEGAAVRLQQWATCTGSKSPPKLRETLTDAGGRLTIGGGVVAGPCIWPAFSTRLDIIAPGYLAATANDDHSVEPPQESVRRGTFELDRVRYRVELEEYDRLAKYSPGDAGSKWAEVFARARTLRVQPVDRPGVFASQPGAAFHQVATVKRGSMRRLLEWSVIAQDRNTGALYEWTTKGTAEAIPALPVGATLLAGRRSDLATEPFFVHPTTSFSMRSDRPIFLRDYSNPPPPTWSAVPAQLGGVRDVVRWHKWLVALESDGRAIAVYDLGRWVDSYVPRRQPGEPREIRPGPQLTVSEIVPGAVLPIECMTVVYGNHPGLMFIARTGGGRGLYRLTADPESDPQKWKADRIDVLGGTLSTAATACAGGYNTLYVALKDQGILRLDIGQYSTERRMDWRYGGKVTARSSRDGSAGPVNFTALAVRDVDYFWEVLYGVAGDDTVYRLSSDLRPDQRIELTRPPVRDERPDR